MAHLPLARPKSLLQKLQSSFQAAWLQDFPWLRYCKDTGLMSCSWCQKTPTDLPPGGHDELSRGTCNYKKTLLLRHHVSTEHKLHEAKAQESEIPSEEGYCDFNSRPNENSYCYQLLQQLNEQRKKGILCDVSIVVSGKIFKAHKNILVAGSRFFKTLYCFSNKESPNQNNTTHLDIAAVQGFSVILDFLYSDKPRPGRQEGVDQGQETDFPRDEEYEENKAGEAKEELADEGDDQNHPSGWDELGDVCMSQDD
ncbi:Zinc finger and BTB domain-containing protein 10 [Myotis brandtii]|uniref:Zinc finger and BTB domain-containing protein 10 n=1 Tax=Myotis brandtii TaxID=109478 RepID=S7N515_MYOBR|nr:Zinc finger and BTB domain-containing protein 10 [Myotis brandtii]